MAIHVVPTDFPTVQLAIDDPGTNPGDSIQILAGTFDGFDVTKERLKIFGCGIGKTIISGNPSPAASDGITVNADQTILKGFTIQGFTVGDGIEVNNDTNILVEIESRLNSGDGYEIDGENNLIINCFASSNVADGFDIDTDHHCIINCESTRSGEEGFDIDGQNNKVINNIAIENVDDGIDLNDDFNIVYGNTTIKNDRGIGVDDDSNSVINNLVCNNRRIGIGVGSGDVEDTNNVIDSNIVRNNGKELSQSGILVNDVAFDNIIRFNKLRLNEPFDIEVEGNVADNTYDGNKCESSDPMNLCT
ncbi:right-handed parallel beta-helix repeat-containing protein [Bacillus solimangrovi]|uniref:Right handed beta helix domain-containing protein n=1 Tax=Bacillus solimangrovi TaxID=1305675 RepID=A0A1E5LJ94_9BACI|nr:right-handed parallel beta-helix repeat-containing protein [Bacillus solimangrovi]OEH94163.1 hypothetical protein BFG57_08910 [Bacillus solimangrovi]